MAGKEKKPYYIEPKVFKESLQKYYESDILTDDLAENIKKKPNTCTLAFLIFFPPMLP